MRSPTGSSPAKTSSNKVKRACFLAALTIVMLGWLSALGWAAATVAKLVIS
jgi:hypothetical protein